MSGDFSRDTFKPERHYNSVRLQQGRVVTDADWNEQADITRRRIELEALDVIGACGAPEAAAGFAVSAATQARAVFAVGDDAWVVGEDGVVTNTVDGGANWFVQERRTNAVLRGVHFATPTAGWIVGDSGTILKTDDGTLWDAQQSDTSASLRGVFALDSARAWAVGDDGIVLRTTDGGTSWLSHSAGGSGRLHAVRFVDSARGFVVGQGGRIASTDDGGETWTPRNSGTVAHLRSLHFADALTGWAAGEGGTVVKTTDGGVTWSGQNTGVAETLRSIAFVDSSHGWAVGDGGVALRTEDGGDTWIREDVGTTATLRGVALASNSLGWIVGDDSTAVQIATVPASSSLHSLPTASLSLAPGRLYVDGVLCELEERTSVFAQSDAAVTPPLAAGIHLLYLDVWDRYISHLEDPAIREVALNGPDTAGRNKTVWQVRALDVGSASPPPTCLSGFDAFDALVAPSKARLRARAEPSQIPTSVCEIGASAGYRRLENQLYRVEVHDGGSTPSFKWSREDASVTYAIETIELDVPNAETTISVTARGLDDNLDLAVGDWVEVVDDHTALESGAGPLFRYVRNGNDAREVVVEGLVPDTVGRNPKRHPYLRRWEQKPTSGSTGTLPIEEGKWVDVEEGVQVFFTLGGTYRSGDFWLIAARTITGNVEWPLDEHDEPLARRPDGVAHHYCRLALVEADYTGTITVLSDCRNLFPPLTAFTQLLYVSGDGQDGIPGLPLPQPLRVRVARGSHGVTGARVRFSVEAGSGQLVGSLPGASLEVTTAGDGLAECGWILDPDAAAAKSYQRVSAKLIDAASQAIEGQTIVFCATGTASLHYVGGDGQDGTAGQTLKYPLQVRVSNGQRQVAGARVRFDVTGGGAIVGANPATTAADGLVSVQWTLGGGGDQRVQAQLLDASNTSIQHVEFSASFGGGDESAGEGCEVTIGEKGRIKELTTQALNEILNELHGRVCLCFLPGQHVVGDLEVSGHGEGRVSIHGCGAATIRLKGKASFIGFALVEIANLEVLANQNCGFAFDKCADVRVSSVIAQAEASTTFPILGYGAIGKSITIEGCRLTTKLSGPAAAVVVDSAEADVRLIDCDVEGVVSFYGFPAPGPPPVNAQKLLQRMAAGHFEFRPSPGRLFIDTCRIARLTIGRDKAVELKEFTDGAPVLAKTFATGALSGLVLVDMQHVFLSGALTLNACSFTGTVVDASPFGSFVAEHLTAVGNLSTDANDLARLQLFARPGRFEKAANAILTLP